MKLSVGLPVYNPDRTQFEATLQAVFFALTDFSEYEVFISDDSETTRVADWLRESRFFGQITYTKNPSQLGIAGNWNRVIDMAKGEFVHIMHQDDLISPAFYHRLVNVLEKHPNCGLSYCRTAYINTDGTTRAESRVHSDSDLITDYGSKFHDLEIVPSAWVMRTKAVRAIGKFDSRLIYNLDREFIFRMSLQYSIGFCEDALNNYRHSEQTQSSKLKRSGAVFIDKNKAFDLMLTYAPASCYHSVIIQKKRNVKSVKTFLLEKADGLSDVQKKDLLGLLPWSEKVVYMVRKAQSMVRKRKNRIAAILSVAKRVWFSSEEIKLVIGASGKGDVGWVLTDIEALDITKYWNWLLIFWVKRPTSILAEHVWEHLTPDQGVIAARNVYRFLKAGGVFRVAVPDGNNPDPNYHEQVKPGGSGAGAHDHKLLYTISKMTETLQKAGFTEIKGMEYFDEAGGLHKVEMDLRHGTVQRSIDLDKRNAKQLTYMSLIVDAVR